MRSHFRKSSTVAVACAVSGATALMTGVCSAQVSASDSASNPIYTGGWAAGQNGGTGFGAWSFNGTDPTPAGTYQGLSSGPAWTLMANSSSTGLANAGRSITGGLLAGETFQTVIQNPINNAGIYTYRGFDILFTSATDNNVGGDNTAALRLSVFDYFNASMNWGINDAGSAHTTLSAIATGASPMVIDLTLGTGNQYALTLAPASNPNTPYLTYSGTLASSIDYVDFRNYNAPSGGVNDTANNLSIGSMEVIVPEPSSMALAALGSISFMLIRRRRK